MVVTVLLPIVGLLGGCQSRYGQPNGDFSCSTTRRPRARPLPLPNLGLRDVVVEGLVGVLMLFGMLS